MSAGHQAKRPEDIRVILQDINDPPARMPWPPTPEGLLSASIDPIRDSGIDVYAYGIHHAGGCTHGSSVYQIVGDNEAFLHESAGLHVNEGVKRLVEQGNDPLKVMCEGAHAAGKDFFLRMRLNDLHDRVGQHANLAAPTRKPKTGFMEPVHYTPKWKKDHPEWLIGDARAVPSHLSFEAVEANAPNYVYAPVRELMFALAAEVVRGYDIDGFEIDFMRFPFFFPRGRAWAHRHVMTAFVRKLRRMIDEEASRRGRPIIFSARFPDTVELCARIGVDVRTLLAEGLLDMCVISGGYMPFSIPWEDIVSLAGEHGVPALACLNHGRVTRWNWTRTQTGLHPEPTPQQNLEQIRAAAHRAYQKGASGIELWNFFYEMPHYYSPEQKEGTHRLGYGFTHELADPEGLAGRRKAYLFDYEMGERWAHACWCAQGPLMIATADDGIGQTVTFDIADDLDGFPDASAELWINIVDLFAEDVIEFEWNGRSLPPREEPYMGLTVYSNREFRFDLPADWVKRGNNEFTVYLRERSPRLEAYVTLNFVRLTIDPGGA
ncbi:MAG: hypothetical protein QGH74_00280 [Candidatus Brocadiia bacterium]|nr:hypothetical protein [Candidatus Brocadiia bacterium]